MVPLLSSSISANTRATSRSLSALALGASHHTLAGSVSTAASTPRMLNTGGSVNKIQSNTRFTC